MSDEGTDEDTPEPDPEPETPVRSHGRHLDYAYDPGASGWWMA